MVRRGGGGGAVGAARITRAEPDRGGETIIERAYALARSGSCANLEEVRRRLIYEGFVYVRLELADKALQSELNLIARRASRGNG